MPSQIFSVDAAKEHTSLKLSGSLTTPVGEEVHRTVREALNGCERLVLDCSDVTEVDVSFLQILVAADGAAKRSHKTAALASPPQGALGDALRRCGFSPPPGATSLAEIFASRDSGNP